MVGVPSEPLTYEIERGHIRRFADAIEDPNPLWQDEIEARKTRFGGILAPPTFTETLLDRRRDEALVRETRVVGGASEHEYLVPIRPGDRITVVSKLADVFRKRGKIGIMTFLVTETTFTNQFGETVARRLDTAITY